MNCTKQNCIILNKIGEKRFELNKLVNLGMLNDKVIKLSEDLDKLILRCIKCRLAIKLDNIIDIDCSNGNHNMFLYNKESHLIVNLYRYLFAGIKNKEMCFLFIEPYLYKNLIEYVKNLNVNIDYIQYYPVDKLIEMNKKHGKEFFKKHMKRITKQIIKDGYSGIRIVGQPSYAVQLTSKDDFLRFESILTEVFKDINIPLLCIYDFYDYTSTNKYIDDEIMIDSFKTHEYLMGQNCI